MAEETVEELEKKEGEPVAEGEVTPMRKKKKKRKRRKRKRKNSHLRRKTPNLSVNVRSVQNVFSWYQLGCLLLPIWLPCSWPFL